jgi:hypothetical protein
MSNETVHPSIEFEGRRYVRRAGAWYDSLSHMKAPAHVSQRIDTNAKGDPAFWEQCRGQDFSDDPKNRGRIRISIPQLIDLDPFTKLGQTAVNSALAFELLELLSRIGDALGAQAIDKIKRTPCPLIVRMLLIRSENQARHGPRIPVTPRPDVIGIAAEPVQELLAHDARDSREATKRLEFPGFSGQ